MVSCSRALVTVEIELPRRAKSSRSYDPPSGPGSNLVSSEAPRHRLDPGLTGAGFPKSAPLGSLPHCHPGSWPAEISGMQVGGGNGGGTGSRARGMAIGSAVDDG